MLCRIPIAARWALRHPNGLTSSQTEGPFHPPIGGIGPSVGLVHGERSMTAVVSLFRQPHGFVGLVIDTEVLSSAPY